MKILLFAGTTEGRILAQEWSEIPYIKLTVCVATDYGRCLLKDVPHIGRVLCERLNQEDIERLLQREKFDLVVDATHPYAVNVTKNLKEATRKQNTAYFRIVREESATLDDADCYYKNVTAVVEALENSAGNILITMGSKQLEKFTKIEDYQNRIYLRILPVQDSLAKCEDLGFLRSHVIAMQGPFSLAMNRATIEQYSIRHLVTKDGGESGGFHEKIEAAKLEKIAYYICMRPALHEEGYTLEELRREIQNR